MAIKSTETSEPRRIMLSEVQKPRDIIEQELTEKIAFEKSRAIGDYWISIVLMVIALLSSFIAGVGGLLFDLSAKKTASIALIPGTLALVATTLKFGEKSVWHYRKQYALERLRRRLLFQLPQSPSTDEIAAISNDLSDLIEVMNREWDGHLSFG